MYHDDQGGSPYCMHGMRRSKCLDFRCIEQRNDVEQREKDRIELVSLREEKTKNETTLKALQDERLEMLEHIGLLRDALDEVRVRLDILELEPALVGRIEKILLETDRG